MEETSSASGPGNPVSQRLPVQGAGWARQEAPVGHPPSQDEFVPLRLVPQQDGGAIELTGPDILLGRHSQADIRLPLPDVSRRHCRLVLHAGRWHVFDLDSLNGIYVNEQQVRQATLRHGDILRIAGFAFEIDLVSGQRTTELQNNVLPYPATTPQERRQAS